MSLEDAASDAPVRSEADAVVDEAPPGFEPGMKVLQTSGRHDVNPRGKSTSSPIRDHFSQLVTYNGSLAPDLAAVVGAWPKLPEAMKAGILAMIKAAAE